MIHRRSRLSHLRATRTHLRTSVNYSDRYIVSMAGRVNRREWRRVGSRQGDKEERNCDKGCWQTVTGTTLSATRFCAYHSPRVYHRRRQCRVRATDLIWSDPSRSDPPSTFCSLPSFAFTIFSEYTWSCPLSLLPEVFLIFSCSCFPPKYTKRGVYWKHFYPHEV